MIKNNESFDNLINYFDSEQYKQLLKGFISVSETAESLLDKFSFNILAVSYTHLRAHET